MSDIVLPSLGADMDEGALVAWLIEHGDSVGRGEIVAEVETDKGIIEVECWDDVIVEELLVEAGETRLAVGTPIARFRSAGAEVTADAEEGTVATGQSAADEVAAAEPAPFEPVPKITPPVRHLAHELGVDVDLVEATGPGGSVTRMDVRRGVQAPLRSTGNGRVKASPRARRIAAGAGLDLAAAIPSRRDGLIVAGDLDVATMDAPEAPGAAETTKPVADKATAMRSAIARSMERSKREIPHYYLDTTVDMERALTWLEACNDERSITDRILPAALLLKASALALAEFGDLNGHWIDGAFQPSEEVNLGVAVSLRGGGLVAPAIHDAASLSLGEMMGALTDLVARARAGRLRGSEMSEQTATVTNLGDRGVERTFPVIVPPQVAIIGFGRVAKAPIVVDGDLTVRPVVHATLAADHRVTDGHTGGLLLLAIDRLLQEPDQL